MRKSRTCKLAIWLCLSNIGSQGFHNSQEESIISGLVFSTEEGAFKELEDAVEGPAKEEMGDDASKGAKENPQKQDESAC